jgi:hypothetical protein
MISPRPAYVAALLIGAAVALISGCDTVRPSQEGTLVLESVLEAGRPLPPVRVSRTWSVYQKLIPGGGGISNAVVELILGERTFAYSADPDTAGLYRPNNATALVHPLETFLLSVKADGDEASASGVVPPRIHLSEVAITVADEAIEAVFLDTLDIGIDSLDISLDARNGFIYPIQVDLTWDSPASGTEGTYWIETRLEPRTSFSSSIVDFFLLPKQVLPEDATRPESSDLRAWRGVYAVPVDEATEPVPEHQLQIFLLRGDQAFAKFETSRDSPERREPESNVSGGLGFVGAVAMDSLSLNVK